MGTLFTVRDLYSGHCCRRPIHSTKEYSAFVERFCIDQRFANEFMRYGVKSSTIVNIGDVQISEPNALICFAGPRVIEQTIREKLPEGFQRAEYLLDHGMLDLVTPRNEIRNELIKIIRMLLGLGPVVVGDLPKPPQDSSSKEFKENSE